MVTLKEITSFLDKELDICAIPDKSNNGLQFEGSSDVKKVAFAVDACCEVFEKAKDFDLLVVHHGISFGDALKYLTTMQKKRVSALVKYDLSVYCAHLPLDEHSKYGNNVLLAKTLGLSDLQKFAMYNGKKLGYKGKFKQPIPLNEFVNLVDSRIDTQSKVLDFGKKEIQHVGVLTGYGVGAIFEAHEEELDALIVGEGGHNVYHEAQELTMNVIFAGHYKTEVFGVKALMEVIKKKFKVEVEFMDVPTGF